MTSQRPLLAAAALILIAGCGGSGVDDRLASPLETTPDRTLPHSQTLPVPSPLPTLPLVPGTDRPTATGVSGSTASRVDTDWGPIWDALPAGFPVFPGAVTSNELTTSAPVSATLASGTSADEIATWMQSHLELATYSTEALSGPLEDGSFVIDSVGDAGCRIETTITPAGGSTIITVRYGADCPIGG